MKKNALAVLLPVAAGVALSGTGFGVWVFSNKIEAKNAYVGFQVEPAVNFTKFEDVGVKVTNTNDSTVDDKLVLDQDYINATSGNAWNVTLNWTLDYEVIDGVIGTTDKAGTYKYDANTEVSKNDIENKLGSLEIYVTTTVDGGLGKYIQASLPKDSFPLNASGYNIKLDESAKKITGNYTFKFAPTSTYNEVKSIEAYKNMVAAIKKDGKLSFELSLINNLTK